MCLVLSGVSCAIQSESAAVLKRSMEQRTALNLSGTGVLGSAEGRRMSKEVESSVI